MGLRIAFVIPPLVDLNSPYAAAPRLTGWLRKLGHEVLPIDLSLEFFLRVFTRQGLTELFAAVDPDNIPHDFEDVYHHRDTYIRMIDDVVSFVQGRDPGLVHNIVRRLPQGPILRNEGDASRRDDFGTWGKNDLARYLSSLMFQDLTTLFTRTLSSNFALRSYGDKLLESAVTFDHIATELAQPPNWFDRMIGEVAAKHIPENIDLVCLTCPFPGNFIGSMQVGRWLAQHRPGTVRALGGGYPSTELRNLTDPRVFDYVDYIAIDDGEVPLQQITARMQGQADAPLYSTFTREDGKVVFHGKAAVPVPRFKDLPAPDYRGFVLDRYVHLMPILNQVARLSNEGVSLKVTAAHGCYWKKCTFCDIHLPYIDDFDPLPAARLADQMDEMHEQTRLSIFHFTDEAAPPPLLVNLALELLRRDRAYQFWGNVRYDPGFTPDRCKLLAAAGMLAVTGGIEIASDALLPKLAKGITVPQVIKVLQAFSEAGIMTHGYLIYGFPGERLQDTINSLEVLRQLFEAKILGSGHYHRFVTTRHSPIGRNPELFGIKVVGPEHKGFADYALWHSEAGSPVSEDTFKRLTSAMNAFARGELLDRDVTLLFPPKSVPQPEVPRDLVKRTMKEPHPAIREDRVCWLGGEPRWDRGLLTVADAGGEVYSAPSPQALASTITRCHPLHWERGVPPLLRDLETATSFSALRAHGMVVV